MRKKIELRHGGHVEIDTSISLNTVRNAMPKFFSTQFGKRETYEVYQGCLIARHTVQFTGCRPKRETCIYLITLEKGKDGKEQMDTLLMATRVNIRPQAAKRLIDKAIEAGSEWPTGDTCT